MLVSAPDSVPVPRRSAAPLFGRLLVASALVLAGCAGGPAPPALDALGALDPDVATLLRDRTAAVDADRGQGAAWGALGSAYEANGLLVQAEACYAEAAARDATDARWPYLRALLRARRGEVREGLADLDTVTRLSPAYLPARWRRGLWLLDLGELDAATAAFRTAADLAPADPAGRSGLALVHLARREDADAAAVLEALLQTTPGDRYALQLLGTAYRRLGRGEEARTALVVGAMGEPAWADPWREAVDADRRGFAAQLKQATLLATERRYEEALRVLTPLAASHPDDLALQIYLGGVHAAAGRLQDALAVLGPILARDPAQFDAHMHLASGYLSAGDLERAAEHATRAIALRPGSASAARLQGMVQWQQGRPGEAMAALMQAMERDPRDPMPSLWMGMVLGQQGRYLEARRRFEDALARDPLLPDALIGVADTHAALGEFAEATRMLDRASRLAPGNPRLEEARARVQAAAAARTR